MTMSKVDLSTRVSCLISNKMTRIKSRLFHHPSILAYCVFNIREGRQISFVCGCVSIFTFIGIRDEYYSFMRIIWYAFVETEMVDVIYSNFV